MGGVKSKIQMKHMGAQHPDTICIFVGGSGDNKDSFDAVISRISLALPSLRFVTFSFRGVEEQHDLPLQQQVDDLQEVVNTIAVTNHNSAIVIVATSMGAYSTAHLLALERQLPITRCILVDPADYTIDKERPVTASRSWSGADTYSPPSPTASMKMKEIHGNVQVDVIHFTLKNYTANGYVPKSVRGVDNEGAVPRLNSNMVRSFFNNTPQRNRGIYMENQALPHAFMRDGDREKNVDTLAQILIQLFK
jgi:pimeloyl-ACP methyl ester carboxylesterase